MHKNNNDRNWPKKKLIIGYKQKKEKRLKLVQKDKRWRKLTKLKMTEFKIKSGKIQQK